MEYLAITALLPSPNVLLEDVIQLTAKHQCNIEDCRITTLGSEFGLIMLVSGNWSTAAKLEKALLALSEKMPEISLHVKRTEPPKLADTVLPYLVQVVALNNPGLVYDVTNFFVSQDIAVNDLQTNPFVASYAETHMNTLTMSLSVPININLADLRERFMVLCDELNVDGIMEPEKR